MDRRPLPDLAEVFDHHGVCWGAYQTFRQLLEEDWRVSETNPVFREVDQPGLGMVRVGGSPLRYSALAATPPQRAPQLGEHTEAILAEVLGLAPHEIGALFDRGIVAGPAIAL